MQHQVYDKLLQLFFLVLDKDMMIMHDYESKLFLMILDMMIMMIMKVNFSS